MVTQDVQGDDLLQRIWSGGTTGRGAVSCMTVPTAHARAQQGKGHQIITCSTV